MNLFTNIGMIFRCINVHEFNTLNPINYTLFSYAFVELQPLKLVILKKKLCFKSNWKDRIKYIYIINMNTFSDTSFPKYYIIFSFLVNNL